MKHFVVLLTIFFLASPLLYTQSTLENNQNPSLFKNSSYPIQKKKDDDTQLFFFNDINLLLYFDHNQAVEITGNESTFKGTLNLAFESIRNIGESWSFLFRSDLYIMEALSLKGRLYENFNPPPIFFEELFFDIAYTSKRLELFNSFKFGIFTPLTHTFPMDNYHLPIVYKTSPYNSNPGTPEKEELRKIGHASVTGNRDDPLGLIVLNRFDTGILYRLYVLGFEWGLSVSNGEEGLDPNSAKTISVRLAFSNETFHSGFNSQIGNIGSVPIKENHHFYQYFFYFTSQDFQTQQKREETYRFSKKTTPNASHTPRDLQFQVGLEAMLHLHGIRDIDLFDADGTLRENPSWLGNEFTNLADLFGYTDGYFSPFAVFNNGSYDDSLQIDRDTIYGLSYLIFTELRYKDFFSLATHFSSYDPNLLSEGNEMYTRRYRGFLRLGFHVKDFLSFFISSTYTHDALLLNWDQFFDREPRDLHYIRDYTVYIGFLYYIGR